MSAHVKIELERLASLHDTERLIRMTRRDLAAELEDIANRYLDLSDCLVELEAAAPRQVEQESVPLVRARLALVQ